jgi:hypothetical protein
MDHHPKEAPMTTHTAAITETSEAELRREIDAAISHTASADAKAGALLTAAGLLAAVYTALAAGPGGSMPAWLAMMAAVATTPVAAALVLLLLALRPRLSASQDLTSFVAYGRQPMGRLDDEPEHFEPRTLIIRRHVVAHIATRKYRLIAVAVDCLIGAVVAGAAVVATAVLI